MNRTYMVASMALALILGTAACSNTKTLTGNNGAAGQNTTAKKVDSDQIKNSLKQANLDNVSVDVDNDKKIVKLSGDVKSAADKDQAERLAAAAAGDYVISNEVGVRPMGDAGTQAKKVDSKTDDAIKAEWKALEAKSQWANQHIRTDVKNGVLTLKGDVDTSSQRETIERTASKLPHVTQVVNELQVKNAGQ